MIGCLLTILSVGPCTGIPGYSRYRILFDDSRFTMDQWEMLSFYLSHCDPRNSRMVEFPAPLLYTSLSYKAAAAKLMACEIDWTNPPNIDALVAILEPARDRTDPVVMTGTPREE
eukprot:sb/3476758/